MTANSTYFNINSSHTKLRLYSNTLFFLPVYAFGIILLTTQQLKKHTTAIPLSHTFFSLLRCQVKKSKFLSHAELRVFLRLYCKSISKHLKLAFIILMEDLCKYLHFFI